MEEEWKESYEKAEELYAAGKYPEAFNSAGKAIESVSKEFVLALRNAAWSARYIGFKDESKRSEMYEIARKYARLMLAISTDVQARNSAIKLLMLLPGENNLELCHLGIDELEKAQFFDESIKEDLLGELKNSLGIEVRKTDPKAALVIFEEAYRRVRSGTKIAGHLMQNAAICWLMLKNKTAYKSLKLQYANRAIPLLEKALKEYPLKEAEHRRSAQNKIDKTNEEIKELGSMNE